MDDQRTILKDIHLCIMYITVTHFNRKDKSCVNLIKVVLNYIGIRIGDFEILN